MTAPAIDDGLAGNRPDSTESVVADASKLARDVAEVEWYHTLELAPSIITPGWFDLRGLPRRLPIPASLRGQRALDIGTFDGFWAFEMERRGAEVVAIDILDPKAWDWPANSTDELIEILERRKRGGAGFLLAATSLGSSVRRDEHSIYDLSPETMGMFDFIFLGSLLMHLRDPVAALESVRSVCRGQLLVVDNVDPGLTVMHPNRPVADLDGRQRPWWWKVNRAGLVRMLEAAGFDMVGTPQWVFMPRGYGQPRPQLTLGLLRNRARREEAIRGWIGDPHLAVLVQPSPSARDDLRKIHRP